MKAVIDEGGRQHTVAVGDVVEIDLRNAEKGETIAFDRVMLVSNGADVQVGTPTVDGVTVEAEVLDPEVKGVKLKVQKWRRRKADSKSARGHRQRYTRIKITRIGGGGS